ncbi:MAG TPA: hypothetical protein VKQ32_28110 [Polyangia bacterium]|nr:hypothetical protein [Polyangia bacterium]
MRLLNVALVVLALLATLGGYMQEKKRLATILALPPDAARTLYERAQLRRERVLIGLTALLVAGAIAALVLFKIFPR